MPNDEIAEIRRIRQQISEECGHDIRKIAAYYRQAEEELRSSGEFHFAEQSSDPSAVSTSNHAEDAT